jgi:hypothetical protein
MSTRNISISLLLEETLGLSGCGGGGGTPDSGTKGNPDPVVKDTTAPVFTNDNEINLNPTIEEGSTNLEIATIVAEDPNGVTFSLDGVDEAYFELTDRRTRAVFGTILKFKVVPDYEDKSEYRVSVKASDSKGNVSTKDFIITLTDKPFTFDVTGNMGYVVEGKDKNLTLLTNEADGDVHFSLAESGAFSLNDNIVTFKAPDFNDTDRTKNRYTTILHAVDNTSDINITLSAIVIKDGTKPVARTFLLTSKRVVDGYSYTDYSYTYDSNKTLVKVIKSGTNISVPIYITYKYSSDHKIMRGYSSYNADTLGSLESIRVFEEKKTDKNKFAAGILNGRLSINEYVNYIWEDSDSVAFKYNMHLIKHMYGRLAYGQTTADLYVYNNDDKLSREITNGNYGVNVSTLTDVQLQTVNAPAGGFPSADTKLSAAQLQSLDSGTMPYVVSQETTYIYDNSGKLQSGKGFVYGDNPKEDSFDIAVGYYGTNVIHTIQSQGKTIEYDQESRLIKVGDYDYRYFDNDGQVRVELRNNDNIVATYNFEEE